ncbi:hypothetical protein LSHI6S_03197 [Leifsonia shinshuensis]
MSSGQHRVGLFGLHGPRRPQIWVRLGWTQFEPLIRRNGKDLGQRPAIRQTKFFNRTLNHANMLPTLFVKDRMKKERLGMSIQRHAMGS